MAMAKWRRILKYFFMPAGLLDSRNRELWENLSRANDIRVIKEFRPDYMLSWKGGRFVIRVQRGNICPESFTHELLHVKLANEKICPGATLKVLASKLSNLTFLTSDGLENIGNAMEHMRMLPLYLDMGYDRESFISDYNTPKLNNKLLVTIKDNIRDRVRYSGKILDVYIVQYFYIVACPNPNYDYTSLLIEYRVIEPALFDILEKIAKAWNQFDPNKENDPTANYRWNFSHLVEELDKWAKGKIIMR